MASLRGLVAVFAASCTMGLIASAGQAAAGGKDVEGVVNLNTAPPELLSLLPGIGPSKARGIVAYRLRHPLRTVDELVRVKGIGRRMVREMRMHLAVAGPSTAHGLAAGHGPLVPSPAPVVPPPSPRGACRPLVQPPRRPLGLVRPGRAAPARFVRSPANHCAPPA
jgi:competence ComEA-like helix-hairpin-helix protein